MSVSNRMEKESTHIAERVHVEKTALASFAMRVAGRVLHVLV